VLVSQPIPEFCIIIPFSSHDRLEEASEILSGMGLALSTPPQYILKADGDFQAKGHFHRITRAMSPATITLSNIFPGQKFTNHDLAIMYPRPWAAPYMCSPPALCASLIRMLSQYPKQYSTVYVLRSDLSELIGYDRPN